MSQLSKEYQSKLEEIKNINYKTKISTEDFFDETQRKIEKDMKFYKIIAATILGVVIFSSVVVIVLNIPKKEKTKEPVTIEEPLKKDIKNKK
jgi:hypothetical protein